MNSNKTLSALLKDAGAAAEYTYSGQDCGVTGITDDTRSVSGGNIFVCVKGGSFDGHSAAGEMLQKGAAAVVCDHDLGLGDRQIIVSDTRKFYGLLTAAWFDHPERELTLVGITGTNGKTTMATMIHHILTHAGKKTGLIGTAGTLVGSEPLERDESTPTTPKVFELYSIFRLMLEKGCTHCVMEVSSFATEQMRIGPAVYEAAVFTNLTQDHLDYHITMENYYQAKKKLFTDHCVKAFINTEDGYGRRLFDEIDCEKLSYGINGGTDVFAGNIRHTDGASRFWICMAGKSYCVSLRMMGSYNIANAAAAMAVCAELKIPMDKTVSGMNSFEGVRGRCEMIPTGRDFYIVCDYAHSPDALENMLPAIKENTEGRLICLFGCGGDRDRKKRPLMAKAAEKYSDYLIVTSDNPRSEDPDAIIDEIITGLEGNIPYDRIADRRGAIFHAVKIARKGDVIVLAGKGHEDYQILKNNVHIHFDEREVCADALRALDDPEIARQMSIAEISRAAEGELSGVSDPELMINSANISSDTRTITSDSIFIALKGERFDGHDFAEDAVKKGAEAVVTSRPLENIPCLVTGDSSKALMSIAAHYRRKFAPKLVGITGSVGKTTTKEMTALALSSKYNTLKTEGNLNNEIGMPFTLLKLTPAHEAAVIEMGMSHFGEIERLSTVCRPGIAVITNIGWSHAENLGSRENILKAKLEILKGSEPNATLIVNGDDDLLYPLKNTLTDRRIITCGVNNKDCDYTAEDIVSEDGKISFTVNRGGEKLQEITLPCVGIHHVTDALIAFAAAIEAGCESAAIAEKLSGFHLTGLRQHIEKRGSHTVIIDCYNAAPDSMKAAIDVLAETVPEKVGKRAAVLGDMLELGEKSPELHEEVGRYAAEKGIDLIAALGKSADFIAKGAEGTSAKCFASDDKEKILEFLKNELRDGDAVLFKASRGVHMEKIIEEYYN